MSARPQKRFLIYAAGLFLILVCSYSILTALQETTAEAKETQVVFGIETPPERLVPTTIKSPQTSPISMQIFEGLFDLNSEGEVVARLVESWDTEDYQTWQFHIRKGVNFHSSPIFKDQTREITAEDLHYSITQYCRPGSYNAYLLLDSLKGAAEVNQGKAQEVSGLKVLDSHTLQVELIRPEPFFINRISTPVLTIFPKETLQEEWKDRNGFSLAVGTGPYMLVSRSDSEVVLKRNPDYWDESRLPQVNRWVFRVIQNDQARFAALKRGQIDLMRLPNSQFPAALDRDGNLQPSLGDRLQITPVSTFNSHLIGINLQKVPDENLRRAMFWGTNRQEMIDHLLYGYADVTGGTVPPGLSGYEPPFEDQLFDPNKARAFLKKSNYSDEPIELIIHDLANSELIGQVFKAQMAQVGINIKLTKLDFGGAVNRIVKGDTQLFSMFFEYVFSSPEPILINLFSSSKIPVPNFFQFSEPKVDDMIDQLYALDRSQRIKQSAQIEKRVMESVPALFLYRQEYLLLHAKKITGLEVNGNNHYFLEKVRLLPDKVK